MTEDNLPRAATEASKPSSSSPGISLLRLRLGGREPVGDTTAETIDRMVKKICKFVKIPIYSVRIFT